jgi:hypothetical protein
VIAARLRVKLISDCFLLFAQNSLKHRRGVRFYFVNFVYYLLECFIFSEITKSILHLFTAIYLIDAFEILSPHLMNNVRTIGLVSFVMSLPFKKA